jgi:hypothetical protein
MRAAGVPVQDPAARGNWSTVPRDKVDPDFPAAIDECGDLLVRPENPAGGSISEEQFAALRRFAQCLRENGMPGVADPGPDGFETMPDDEAAYASARRVCGRHIALDPDSEPQG